MLIQNIISIINNVKGKIEKRKAAKERSSTLTTEELYEAKKAAFKPLELHNTNSWIEKKYCDTYNKNLGNFGRYTEKMIPLPKTDEDYKYNMSLATKYNIESAIEMAIIVIISLFAVYVGICLIIYALYTVLLGIGWLANNVAFFRRLLGSGLWIIINSMRHLLPWGWFW